MKIDRIFYINFDHHIDKRKKIEEELEKMDIIPYNNINNINNTNLVYERFSAIEDDTVNRGNLKSHAAIVKLAKERGYSNIIILEDDFMFSVSKKEFYKELENLQGIYMDVCLLSSNIISYNISNCNNNVFRVFRSQNTTGYLIHCSYIDVLIKRYESAIIYNEHVNNSKLFDIDIVWNILQSTDPWYVLKNMIGQQRPKYNSSENLYI